MSPEKSPDTEFIKEIFERKKKTPDSAKKVSALFGGGGAKTLKSETRLETRKVPLELLPVGIDIGSSEIRAVQLAKNDGQLQVVKIGSRRSDEIKRAIKDLVQENGLKGEAVLGLSAKEVKIRVLKMPPMPAAEIDSAIRWEVGETLGIGPRRIDDYCLDYDVLEDSMRSPSKENNILVAMVPKDIVSRKIQEVNEAGLNVIAVEPSPLALFAGLSYFSSPRDTDVTLLLDIGYDISSLSIALGQNIYFVQDIATTGNFLTEAIRDYFQIDYKDAEELKCQYGLENWSSAPEILLKGARAIERQDINSLMPALASGLENLIVDIEHSYKYLSNQLLRLSAGSLSRIIISGGGGRLKGIDSFLRNRFNIPAEVFNPLSSLIIGDEVIGKVNLKESGVTFGIAVGLALRGKEEREAVKSYT